MANYSWGDNTNVVCSEHSIKEHNLYRTLNEIWFNCEVKDESINKLIKLMYEIIHDDKMSAYREKAVPIEIILHIDSYGGSVKSMFKFIDFVYLLKKRDVRLRTIINGCAASAASLMAIVGDERQMTAHSYAMIHELSTIYSGTYTHIKSYSKCIDFLQRKISDIYVKHRVQRDGMPELDIADMLQKETWMDADEYQKLGFVDTIL